MKKKTTITTEKHEVWVIRQSPGETKEQYIDADSDESPSNSVIALLDEASESNTPPEEQ
ncbi:MAG: hypothetical protein ABI923_03060 [bacterium]